MDTNILTDIIVPVITTSIIVGSGAWYYKQTRESMRQTNNLLQRFISHFNKNFTDKQFLYTKSPLALTTRGKEAVAESGIDAYIEKHKSEHMREIEKLGMEVLEVQVFNKCKEIAEDVLSKQDDEDALKIQQYFYDKGIGDENMKGMFAVALREYHLKKVKANT